MLTRVPPRPSDLGITTTDGKDAWREGQKDVIDRILNGFETKRFVLLNAPTGSGKTIIATAVQRILALPALMLVHTIQLQIQHQRTMPWATVLTGRGNHACDLPGYKDLGIRADVAPCTQGDDCEFATDSGCSYYRLLYEAAANPQVVLNYAYATRILQTGAIRGMADYFGKDVPYNPFRRHMLICDEADLSGGAIVQAFTLSYSRRRWSKYNIPRSDGIDEWREWAAGRKEDIDDAIHDLDQGCVCVDHSRVFCRLCSHLPPADKLRERSKLRSMSMLLEATQAMPTTGEWIVCRERDEVVLRPVWPWTVAEKALWLPNFERILLMSATLGDPLVITRQLGIRDSWAYIDVPSNFPVENRPIFYWPVMKVSRKTGEDEWDVLASAIRFIAEQPALVGRKGLVHTASFDITDKLYDRLRQDGRYVKHVSGVDRTALVEDFSRSERPVVLLSPSLTTGVDLPYTIGWQVVAKVPFANLGDPVVRAQRDYGEGGDGFGRRYYDAQAMNSIVQAYGRGVRAADDQAVAYILDGNFWPLYKRAYSPEYFQKALRWLRR